MRLPLETIAVVLQVSVGVLGAFLGVQAYRGYRRHGSRTMRWIAIGLVFLTTVPVALSYGLGGIDAIGDATRLLLVALATVLGLGAFDRAFGD